MIYYEEAKISWQGVLEGALEITHTKGKVTMLKSDINSDPPYTEFLLERL